MRRSIKQQAQNFNNNLWITLLYAQSANHRMYTFTLICVHHTSVGSIFAQERARQRRLKEDICVPVFVLILNVSHQILGNSLWGRAQTPFLDAIPVQQQNPHYIIHTSKRHSFYWLLYSSLVEFNATPPC